MKNTLDKTTLAQFRKDGFLILDNFFSIKEMDKFESTITSLYLMQANKIEDYKKKLEKTAKNELSYFELLCAIIEMMETNDKEALFQILLFFGSSPIIRDIFNTKFQKIVCSLLGSNNQTTLIDGPGLFINRPNTDRLLYKWHSEAHYYPKRRNFINIWFPLFNSKTKSNGTMSFKKGSHKKDFPFTDYKGYNKDSQNESNYYNQFEIPSNFVDKYEEYFCEVKRGDLIIFNRRLVHRSNNNSSKKYSFAAVARVWDPTNDLTLSGNLNAMPYGNNIGRSNLVVEP